MKNCIKVGFYIKKYFQRYEKLLLTFMQLENIPIWIDFRPAIAHDKIIIVDSNKVITGSFNFTYAAESRNAENLLIISDNKTLVQQYVENWKNRQQQSRVYTPTIGE